MCGGQPLPDLNQDKLTVFHLESPTDHRQRTLAGRDLYFSPLDKDSAEGIDRIWNRLAGDDDEPLVIENKGRLIELPHHSNGVARVTFADLCSNPLGPSDYLAITSSVAVLIMENIPILSRARNNEAKRFVTLIDAIYEAKRRFICSAEAEPDDLYLEGEGAFEFQRTASRLTEMRSADWGDDAH